MEDFLKEFLIWINLVVHNKYRVLVKENKGIIKVLVRIRIILFSLNYNRVKIAVMADWEKINNSR
jgi:hypothetical protein